MFDPKFLDDLSRGLAGLFPANARGLHRDLEHNLRASLSAAFAKLDLVTREELEIQTAVLERTRAKLAALEARVEALEQESNQPITAPSDPHPADRTNAEAQAEADSAPRG